jgi:uncharacterized protein YbaA (DUF1428 family)
MNYVDGYLLAVPTDERDAYRKVAEAGWVMFQEWGRAPPGRMLVR